MAVWFCCAFYRGCCTITPCIVQVSAMQTVIDQKCISLMWASLTVLPQKWQVSINVWACNSFVWVEKRQQLPCTVLISPRRNKSPKQSTLTLWRRIAERYHTASKPMSPQQNLFLMLLQKHPVSHFLSYLFSASISLKILLKNDSIFSSQTRTSPYTYHITWFMWSSDMHPSSNATQLYQFSHLYAPFTYTLSEEAHTPC